MTCNACGEKPKKTCNDFTKAVIEINNPETLVLLRKVVIPTSMGDEEQVPPAIGKYHNVLLQYEANDHIYLYSSDGIPTAITANIPQEVLDSIEELEDDVVDLQEQVDDLKNSPDVVDIVPTYAALQTYDTSKLGDNDIIRVLQDEQHDGQSTYYRWDKQSSTWTYIGAVGDYYTKGQVDSLLDDKQDVLTAGANITINANNEISATDTTYSDFVGTDGTAVGTAGLVPAPATTDAGKYLKADGTWDSVQAGPTVVQTTGNSTADVMSQDATTKMIYNSSSTLNQLNIPVVYNSNSYIRIGGNTETSGQGNIAIGFSAQAGTSSAHQGAIAIGSALYGSHPKAGATGAIAIGEGSQTATQGVFTIGGLASFNKGYNNSHYRLLTGLYDPQSDHDAATKGYVDTAIAAAGGANTINSTDWSALWQ